MSYNGATLAKHTFTESGREGTLLHLSPKFYNNVFYLLITLVNFIKFGLWFVH